MEEKKNKLNKSEIRQNIISGEWVVVAPGRAGRPESFARKEKREKMPKSTCPFEDPQKSGNGAPVLMYPRDARKGEWKIQVINNKYPAFTHKGVCAEQSLYGPYTIKDAVGYHRVVITRDHNKGFAELSSNDAYLVFKAFREDYARLAEDSCIDYISIFHNWGAKAGASIYHPHYQIMAIPVIPPRVSRSLRGAKQYQKKHNECVHCMIVRWEKKEKIRVIYENKNAIAITPFLSRESFEVGIFPKKHTPYFEDASDALLRDVSEALRAVLGSMKKKLKDPDLNFYIHVSPVSERTKYDYYHWHIGILPKMSIFAGFELGTGIEVTVVDPDEAAKFLRVK
jgi:UDPglucose--hexose-1-phosphate uridylyltransferase